MIFSLLFIHFNKCYLQHAKKTHTYKLNQKYDDIVYTQELSCINAWLARDAKNKKRKAIKAMQYGMCNCVICRSKLVIVYLPCINKYYFPFWNHKNWNFNVAFSLCCCCWVFSVGLWANELSKQAKHTIGLHDTLQQEISWMCNTFYKFSKTLQMYTCILCSCSSS